MPHARAVRSASLLLPLLAACAQAPAPAAAPPPSPAPVASTPATPVSKPAAAPEQKATPVTRRVSLCALAPDSLSGLATLEALVAEGSPDTLALRGGQSVPLAQALPRLRLPEDSYWFPAGRTLDVPVARVVQRYAIYDVGREIEPGQLAYLGMLERMPVFAAVDDVAPVKAELERVLATEKDLATILLTNAALRTRFRALDVLYVPLHATGCVFQPLLRKDTP